MWAHKKQLAASRAADPLCELMDREGGIEAVEYLGKDPLCQAPAPSLDINAHLAPADDLRLTVLSRIPKRIIQLEHGYTCTPCEYERCAAYDRYT